MTDQLQQTLTDTLSTIRNRIQQIRKRKEGIGEQNTKAILIEPLLAALGWDLGDIDEVSREYKRKSQDNPVDYALFVLRTPRLFVEAKAFETDLSDRKWISQTLGYATVVGVEWCVLSDGDEYRIYNAHAPVDVEEKLFRVVRLSDTESDPYILNTLDLLSKDKMGDNLLNTLWQSHFVDHRVKAALDDIIQSEDNGLIRLIRKREPEITPSEIRESLKRADVRVDFPLLSITQPVKRPDAPKPTRTPKRDAPKVYSVKLTDLIQAGLISPPLEIEKKYRGANLKATIRDDGQVVFDGVPYDSLSTAAGEARKSVRGDVFRRRRPQTNGWTFWLYRDAETGQLKPIDALRQKFLKSR